MTGNTYLYKVVASSYDCSSHLLFSREDRVAQEQFVQDMAAAMADMIAMGEMECTTDEERKNFIYLFSMEYAINDPAFVEQMVKRGYTRVNFDVRVELNSFCRPLTLGDDMDRHNGEDDEVIQKYIRDKHPALIRKFSLEDF